MSPLAELVLLWLAPVGVAAVIILGSRLARMDREHPATVPPTPQRVVGPVRVTRLVPPRPAMPSEELTDKVDCADCGKKDCAPAPDGYPLPHTVGRGRMAELCGCGRPR